MIDDDEARIRYQNEVAPTCPPGHSEIKILLRLLDQARAEAHQRQTERNEAYGKFHEAEKEILALRDEIARLTELIHGMEPPR